MNVAAFYRLAAVVGAFTRHMLDVNNILTETGEYENVCRHMQNCTLQSDRGEYYIVCFIWKICIWKG